jgi:hypothetical protein
MIAAGQRYVERLVSRVRDANTEDPAHSTGTQAIVSFHVHEHGNSGNVAKASDDIGVEGEKASREGIVCRHADRELEQFTYERIDEGVCVPWLFWTRYDPNTKNVVLSEALLWREVVVENEEDPRGMLPLFKRSEAVITLISSSMGPSMKIQKKIVDEETRRFSKRIPWRLN